MEKSQACGDAEELKKENEAVTCLIRVADGIAPR